MVTAGRRRRLTAWAAGAALTTGVVAGCGGGDGKNPGRDDAKSSTVDVITELTRQGKSTTAG